MKIALAQINTTVGDFGGNAAKIMEWAGRAKDAGAGLVVFPELCVCGYPPLDLVGRADFLDENSNAIERLAAELPDIPVIAGHVSQHEGRGKGAANTAAVLSGGKLLFSQSKMLLPAYDVLDEPRYFQPATGQKVFELDGIRIGLTICEDAWNDDTFWDKPLYLRDPVAELAEQGIDLLINISASPFSQGKRTLRRTMLQNLARKHGLPVVMVNSVGAVDELIFDGSSLAIDAEGIVRAEAASFVEDMVLFDTETGEGEMHEQPGEGREGIVEVQQALEFGLKEYSAKNGFESSVVGLSGGIDSSVVATLAVNALGAANVTGIAMPGPYSSPASLEDARQLASNLGIEFHVMEIGEVFEACRKTLNPVFDGRPEDVTEENLQARVRDNLLMAFSNKTGALMLATGNKSELATGYCTLYGDLAGGLAILADVYKTGVYELANYLNREAERIPARCLTKEPSAELRPGQKDSDALPPYATLDRILFEYVEENRGEAEIAGRCSADIAVVRDVTRRIRQSEFKRRQAPTGLKVTARAFGSGRRYPIALKDFYSPDGSAGND